MARIIHFTICEMKIKFDRFKELCEDNLSETELAVMRPKIAEMEKLINEAMMWCDEVMATI